MNKKIKRIEEIKKEIEAERVSFEEIAELEALSKEIKKYFPADPLLWQWADIPEEEYINQ